jgi:hypothetical protein
MAVTTQQILDAYRDWRKLRRRIRLQVMLGTPTRLMRSIV